MRKIMKFFLIFNMLFNSSGLISCTSNQVSDSSESTPSNSNSIESQTSGEIKASLISKFKVDSSHENIVANVTYVIKPKVNAVGVIKITIQEMTKEFAYDFSAKCYDANLLRHTYEGGTEKMYNGVLIDSLEKYHDELKDIHLSSKWGRINEEYFKRKNIIAVEVGASYCTLSVDFHSLYIADDTLYVEFISIDSPGAGFAYLPQSFFP